MLRLVPYPGKLLQEELFLTAVIQKSPAEMCMLRGKEIAMIFQDPMTTLNPVFKVGEYWGISTDSRQYGTEDLSR